MRWNNGVWKRCTSSSSSPRVVTRCVTRATNILQIYYIYSISDIIIYSSQYLPIPSHTTHIDGNVIQKNLLEYVEYLCAHSFAPTDPDPRPRRCEIHTYHNRKFCRILQNVMLCRQFSVSRGRELVLSPLTLNESAHSELSAHTHPCTHCLCAITRTLPTHTHMRTCTHRTSFPPPAHSKHMHTYISSNTPTLTKRGAGLAWTYSQNV